MCQQYNFMPFYKTNILKTILFFSKMYLKYNFKSFYTLRIIKIVKTLKSPKCENFL